MESPKVLLQVEIFCNDIIEDYEDKADHNDREPFNRESKEYDDQSGGWYECATAILKLIEDKRKIL